MFFLPCGGIRIPGWIIMKRGNRRRSALLLCGILAAGGILGQMVPVVAESECTCVIQVHGSNCPLSLCTCGGSGEHAEDCALYGKNSDLAACVCVADIHAEGCPRYDGDGTAAADASGEAEADGTGGSPAEETVEAAGDTESAGTGNTGTEETGDMADAGAVEDSPVTEGNSATESSTVPENSTVPESSSAAENSPAAEDVRDPDTEPLEAEVPEDPDAMEEGWEYPSGWSGYGDGQMEGNLLAAAEAFRLELLLDEHTEEIRGLLTNGENARISEGEGSFGDVLAVYAVLSGQTENYPQGVLLEDGEDAELLRSVYWSMTQVTGVSNAEGAAVYIYRLGVEEAAELYGFTDAGLEEALSLAGQGDTVDAIVEESIFASLTEEELEQVLELVPEDLPAGRRAVLLAAVSLVGKVDYFWGGKSLSWGWDDRWGELRTVASTGSDTYGTARPLGLDCSGFVSWAFLNAFGSEDATGNGTTGQWSVSETVAWEDAMPGDLVFYYSPDSAATNHVGIVLTVDGDGPETVVHCSSSGGVQISGADRFSHVRRPLAYSG